MKDLKNLGFGNYKVYLKNGLHFECNKIIKDDDNNYCFVGEDNWVFAFDIPVDDIEKVEGEPYEREF